MIGLDVHVVGCGPAGSVFARAAAEKSLGVTVSEEHSLVGEPAQCSGLISKSGLESLGVDYSKSTLNRIYGARIHAPDGSFLDVGGGVERAIVVDRARLDRVLADAAEKAGARLVLGERVTSYSGGKVVVGADGCASRTAAANGFPEISDFVVGYQADYEEASVRDEKTLDLLLSNERFPGFFAWVIPLGAGRARVGLGVSMERAGSNNVRKVFEKLVSENPLAKETVDGARKAAEIAGCIPIRAREKTVKGNVLLVGDAAGQVKATTGGGIVFGTRAAVIAAECASDFVNGKSGLGEYEAKWRSELGSDLSTHYKLRRFLNRLDDSGISKYVRTSKSFGVERFLNKYGDMDRTGPMLDSLNSPFFYPLKKVVGKILSG